MEGTIHDIGEAILDENFPEVDLALRRGRHIDRDDGAWYAFIVDAQSILETFYARYGCELIHRTDGYFYLLPSGDRLGRRQLSTAEMVVGQGLALMYLDPKTIESGGVVTRTALLGQLATVMGSDALTAAMGHKRRRNDERIAQQAVRRKVAAALRRLGTLGFVALIDEEQLRLRAALMRFAEPVRGSGSPVHALEVLLAKGEVVLGEGALGDDDELDDLGNEEFAEDEAIDEEGDDGTDDGEHVPATDLREEPGDGEFVEDDAVDEGGDGSADDGEHVPATDLREEPGDEEPGDGEFVEDDAVDEGGDGSADDGEHVPATSIREEPGAQGDGKDAVDEGEDGKTGDGEDVPATSLEGEDGKPGDGEEVPARSPEEDRDGRSGEGDDVPARSPEEDRDGRSGEEEAVPATTPRETPDDDGDDDAIAVGKTEIRDGRTAEDDADEEDAVANDGDVRGPWSDVDDPVWGGEDEPDP